MENENIISKVDLGNGKKQVTFSVATDSLDTYFKAMTDNNIDYSLGHNIAKGSVRSRYETQGRNPLNSTNTPYTTALKTPSDPHDKISLATELYFKEPIIGTTIDLMVDFSASGFVNECENREIRKIYDEWGKQINLNETLENIFLEYYRSGNVTIYKNDDDLEVKASTKKGRGKSSTKSYKFPSGYTILNPMNVVVEGSLLSTKQIVKLRINDDIIKGVKENNPKITESIPSDLLKSIRSGDTHISLDQDLVTRITRKKQPYERYATPFLERVFEPIMYKQKLRQMDMSTIDGLLNQLVTVTVGNDEYPASDDDLTAIAELFQTPSKAYTVFWNHTLNVTFHKPEGIETLNQDKYKQVNDDILSGLGVSRVLIDGQGSNFSTAWVSILSLIERLENARDKVVRWLESEYKNIADENDLETHPKVQFNKMNLREDNYIRDVLIALYDRGLLDEEDVLKETGRDYDSIIETKKRNKTNRKLFLPPEQPFQGGSSSPNNGKPTGKNQNGYKDRDSTPEQNSGNAPKAKAGYAMAYSNNLDEEYEFELLNAYETIQQNFQELVSNNDSLDKAFLFGSVIGFLASLKQINERYIDSICQNEVTRLNANYTSNLQESKKTRVMTANSYVDKLAFDIADKLSANTTTENLTDSISQVFSSSKYRVKMMATENAFESRRTMDIGVGSEKGFTSARWVSHLDEKTCNVCAGLHGQVFKITEVPPRTHANCRCSVEFI